MLQPVRCSFGSLRIENTLGNEIEFWAKLRSLQSKHPRLDWKTRPWGILLSMARVPQTKSAEEDVQRKISDAVAAAVAGPNELVEEVSLRQSSHGACLPRRPGRSTT